MAGKPLNLTGQRYARLLVCEFSHTVPSGGAAWWCKCDCGKRVQVTANHLRMGNTKSCGCLNTEVRGDACRARATHGHARKKANTKTYQAWSNMHARCRPESPDAAHYHARGIAVCSRWQDFEAFLTDMGEVPVGLTLDRIDGGRGYEPGNCRWTDWATQQNNKRDNHLIVVGGVSMTMKQAAVHFGMNYSTLRSRINQLGWTPEEAILS